jgi:hypothetical protein
LAENALAIKKALLSRCVFQDANDRRAKDGETELAMSRRMVGVESVVGSRIARAQPVATASQLVGILFAHGRRIVNTWLSAVGVSDDFYEKATPPGA